MRAIRSVGTLVVLGGSVLLAYGCSAAGNAPVGGDAADGSTPTQDYGGGGDNSPSDASTGTGSGGGKKDSGASGGYDAGPPKAPEGSPCDVATQLSDPQATQTCGLCGTQTRACISADGGATGAWAAWGSCTGEVTAADKCDPATTYAATACGNCGTMPQICGSDCHFETGFDCTEPANACHPGDVKFVLGASCTTSGQGRVYTCGATCAFGSPSACELPPPNPNSLTISPTAGQSVNATFALSDSNQTDRVTVDTCPTTLGSSSTDYIDIGIVNPTTRTVTVSVWDGRAAGATSGMDTVMSWYASPVWPPADRTMCQGSVSDDCDPSATCANTASGDTRWSSLAGTNAVSIPPNGTVTVTVALYSSSGTPGSFKLFARTEN